MLSNFSQAHRRVGSNPALLVARLQPREMPQHLDVEVVVVELRRQVNDRLDGLLANGRVCVEKAVRHLRKYLIVDNSWRQVMHKQFQLLQQTRPCHAIRRREQLHHTWHDSLLVVGFVEQAAQLEHWPEHHRARISVLVSCYQLRQDLVAAHVVGKVVEHRRQSVKEPILLSLIFDLDLLEEQQRVDQLVLEESPGLAASRDDVGWVGAV